MAESKPDKLRTADRREARVLQASATLLGEQKDYKLYAQYFLGDAPRSVADRHYIVPSAEEFKRALTWLAGQYGIG